MELRPIKSSELLRMAHDFRMRAEEAVDTEYHRMMLRTAVELEELADELNRRKGSELVLKDDEGDC